MGTIIKTQTRRMCEVFLSKLSDGEKHEAARLLLQETSILGSLEQDTYGSDPFASSEYDRESLETELNNTVADLEPLLVKAGIESRDAYLRAIANGTKVEPEPEPALKGLITNRTYHEGDDQWEPYVPDEMTDE